MNNDVFPALKLDEHGRCPNCLRKPMPYKRDHHWFCPNCCRSYRMDTGEQQSNWAWLMMPGGFIPRYYPDSGTGAGDYVRAQPTAAAKRRAMKGA